MKHTENNINDNDFQKSLFKNVINTIKSIFIYSLVLALAACSNFVEIDPPKNTLVSETVFEDPSTVESALANVYYKMRESGMVSGNFGLGILMSSYADELDYYNFDANFLNIYNHNVIDTDNTALEWWSHAYKVIYAVNDIIKGVENSSALTSAERDEFKGQALFIRANMHSLLVAIYGDVPYITTTNYLENNTVYRMPQNQVYDNIIADLSEAISLLNDTDSSGEKVIPNKSVAKALLARIYLYTENWELAEEISSEVISAFSLESDITKVFLKESLETIWQFKPNGVSHNNTYEANWLIIRFIPGQSYALNNSLLNAFEPNDLRYDNWIGSNTSSDGLTTLQYAFKYKEIFTQTAALEYSIIFRLAEQYLIRSEARVHQGDIAGSQQDLNAIRNRAGLPDTTASTMSDLIDAILQERHVELFTEQGHRWFDLKRTGKASDVLSPIKTNWSETNILFPIPANELELNSHLNPQNPGY
ncbi:RagB/SusD family nutrient uptake outer membrane protein [Gelidibacter sp. F63206]|uniref:RagB/SusD family nutrient uptake outer membrane protein n=1 Tax=Gelidibacter sp. F63206 TaxID=2926425 RepID=UPI001FF4E2F3|nr:RagB/SusD family nutrient uptake outer membrane protein [Gelidibacter sp. F63206]MCK0114819.1 RagB/SusD family nutrient uptake outer membrane protein [Gelidibacter sp. F63206]